MMRIEEYIKQCITNARNKIRLPSKKTNFSFLCEDEEIRNCEKSYFWGAFRLTYPDRVFPLNKKDKILFNMEAHIYPQAPFYKIAYIVRIVFADRKIGSIVFDETELYTFAEKDLFGLFIKEKDHLISILDKQGYKQVNFREIEKRIALVDVREDLLPAYILGCQPTVERLVGFGVEFARRNRNKFDPVLDYHLKWVADEIVHIVKHMEYRNGQCVVSRDIHQVDHTDAIRLINDVCLKYGGERLSDTCNAYVWRFKPEEVNEGEVTINIETHLYLSRYAKAFFVKVHQVFHVKSRSLPAFVIKTINYEGEHRGLFNNTLNQVVESILGLEELGYQRLLDMSNKLSVKESDSLSTKEVEVGAILFDLKPHEYSQLDIVEKE